MDARRSGALKYNISKATLKFYICGMIATKSYITELIKDSIKKKNPEAEIILFGSQARGESKLGNQFLHSFLLKTIGKVLINTRRFTIILKRKASIYNEWK